MEPTHTLVLTPAPAAETETEYRWVTDSTSGRWLAANPITTSGFSTTSTSGRLARLRNAFDGFRGYEYRLKSTPSVTAQCFWTFTEDPVRPPPPPPPPPPGPPPVGGGPSPGGPSDPAPPDSPRCGESDREYLGSFYEMTDGENWHEKENWNSDKPLGEWFGVGTDEDGSVVSLLLSGNNLSGDMPTEELLCLTELVELALWDNDGLSGEIPEERELAVERAVLRDVAEALSLSAEWFEDYEEPFDFEDWHRGVTTDDDRRVIELDFTEEEITGEIPGSIFELRRLGVIETGCGITLEIEAPGRVSVMMPDDCAEEAEETVSSGDGGCALGSGDSSVFGLFLVTLLVFAVLGRRARD